MRAEFSLTQRCIAGLTTPPIRIRWRALDSSSNKIYMHLIYKVIQVVPQIYIIQVNNMENFARFCGEFNFDSACIVSYLQSPMP